jgi:hypothetical protein
VTSDYKNPYAERTEPARFIQESDIEPALQKKIEAIISDANHTVIAILLCINWVGFGGILVGLWYLIRLRQWHAIAKAYPALLEAEAPWDDFSLRFTAAKKKLVLGVSIGFLTFILTVVAIGIWTARA